MKSNYSFQFTTAVIGYPLLFVFTAWLVFWAELRLGLNFNSYGIYPRTLFGLVGIFLSTFIHGSLEHLYHNSLPLLVLSMALFYFYRPLAWRLVFFGILLSGFLTWCIAKPAYHIGASGLVYVLMSFLLFKGLFSKHYRLIALSLVVVFLYGGMLWYIFPVKEKLSWEGHLSGFITGFIFALIFNSHALKPELYAWESEDYDPSQDPFLQQFDADGNFIESSKSDISSNETRVNYSTKADE